MSVGYAMESRVDKKHSIVDKKHSSKEKLKKSPKKDRVAKAESVVKKFDVRKEYSVEPRLSMKFGNERMIKCHFDKCILSFDSLQNNFGSFGSSGYSGACESWHFVP